jgi:hypothetical protein
MLEYKSTVIASILGILLHRYAKVKLQKKNVNISNNVLKLTLPPII